MAHRPFVQEKAVNHRPARFAQMLKEELSQMIPGSLRDPRLYDIGFLTITSVTITPDLKYATILFALMGQTGKADDITDALNSAANFLRKQLMHKLDTKITPHLLFKYDKGLSNTMEVDALLKQVEAHRKENPIVEDEIVEEDDAHFDDADLDDDAHDEAGSDATDHASH